jgi:hypothetical protein
MAVGYESILNVVASEVLSSPVANVCCVSPIDEDLQGHGASAG